MAAQRDEAGRRRVEAADVPVREPGGRDQRAPQVVGQRPFRAPGQRRAPGGGEHPDDDEADRGDQREHPPPDPLPHPAPLYMLHCHRSPPGARGRCLPSSLGTNRLVPQSRHRRALWLAGVPLREERAPVPLLVNCVAERVLDYRRQSGRSSACRLMARQGAKPVKPVWPLRRCPATVMILPRAGSKPGRLRLRRTTSTLVGRAPRPVRRDPPFPAGRRSRLPPRLYRRK